MKNSDIYAKSFSKLIQKPTVTNSGDQYFEQFQQVLKEEFPKTFENLQLTKVGGNALLFKWKGKDSSRPIILMAHQDVVPANDLGWKYPPFSGQIADGKVWGRGAMDCKNTVFCTMSAVEELLEEGVTPNQDVYLSFSDNEETGGQGAVFARDWFIKNNIKPVMVIDEGGAIVENAFPGMVKPYAMVGILEKGYCDIKFIAKSAGGHSSTPPKNTPFVRLSKLINYFSTHNIFKYEMSPAAEAMLYNLSDGLSGILKFITKNVKLFKPLIVKVLPKLTPMGDALFATTMVFTMAKGADAPNVIPEQAWVVANLRYSPQEDVDKTIEKIRKIAKKYDCEIELSNNRPACPMVDINGADYNYFIDTLKSVYPEIGVAPYVIFGGTDCRTMQEIAPCALRCAPNFLTEQQLHSMHAANENIDISSLEGGIKFYKEFIKNFK